MSRPRPGTRRRGAHGGRTVPARRRLAAAAAVAWTVGQLLAAGPAAAAGEADVQVFLEPREASPGETVSFQIVVASDGITQPRLTPDFELDNLHLVAGPQTSQNLSLRNGRGRWSFSWTWYLRPLAAGEAAVTSIRVRVGSGTHEVPPQRLRVLPGDLPRPEPPSIRGDGEEAAPDVFLHARAEPSSPFVGQRTIYSAYLYHRVNVSAFRAITLPAFEGCWNRDVDPTSVEIHRVMLDGALYERRLLLRRELYPLRAGSLDLGRLDLELIVDRIKRDRLHFAPFRVRETVLRQTNPVTLSVRPLPEPGGALGERFGGVVGPLELEARLSSTEVAVGHAATLTVSVTGEGHLAGLEAPAIRTPEPVEVLGPQEVEPPPADERGGAGDDTAGGAEPPRRTWSYLLVPHQVGSWQLPPVEVAYFDPETERYRVASSAVPELGARPEALGDGAQLAPADGSELRPIRNAALPAPARRRSAALLPWAFGVGWVLALSLLVAREAGLGWPPRAALGADRQALGRFRDELGHAVAEDRPRRAAAGLERAWRHLLTEWIDLPEGAGVSVWLETLETRGVAPEPRRRFAELLEDLHFLRYAPELSDAESLAGELAERSERLARELARERLP